MAFILPHILLAKAIMRRSATQSIQYVTLAASVQDQRARYILSVLQSNKPDRDIVRAEAAALAPTHPFRAQLCTLLTMFETLTDAQKADFIITYKACATLGSQGSIEVAHESTSQPGHVPPHNVP